MVKRSIFGIVLLIASHSFAQQNPDIIRAGLLKGDLAFNQSFMLEHKSKNVYLSGFLEYYSSKNLSLRGDCMWYMDSRQKDPVFKQNYVVLFGAVLHKPIGRNDLFGGIQPGMSFTQPVTPALSDNTLPLRMMPVLDISIGYTLYFSKFCNFFLSANYLASRYRGADNGSLKLDEFMISGGLGFHINTIRKQKK